MWRALPAQLGSLDSGVVSGREKREVKGTVPVPLLLPAPCCSTEEGDELRYRTLRRGQRGVGGSPTSANGLPSWP